MMNIAAIKRECVSRRKAEILDVLSDGQWISDGVAAWPVEGLRLSVGGLESLFNLSKKQLDKLQILDREVADVDYRRYRLSDDEDTDIVGMLMFSGETFVAVRSHRGLLYDLPAGEYEGRGVDGVRTVTYRAGRSLEVMCHPITRIGAEAKREAKRRRTSPAAAKSATGRGTGWGRGRETD